MGLVELACGQDPEHAGPRGSWGSERLKMDAELTDQQLQLQKSAIEFARARLGRDMIDRDRNEVFDREGWKRCAEFGVIGSPVPREYGGLGLGLTDLLATMEGLGYGSTDAGLLFSINAHLWAVVIPILTYGSDEQKRRYLPKLTSGEWIGANAASEPDAGSDVFSLRTVAERRSDVYVLNGTKMFVSNAPVADVFVAYATIDPSLGPRGVTGFIVDRDVPGLAVTKPMDKMGLRTSPMAEVVFESCEVPVQNRLGREGRGVGVFDCSMEWERGCILATCLGTMRRQLETCIEHAQNRKQFGQAIGKFQSVANRIVDMKVRLEACRPLVYRIGRLKDAGRSARLAAAIAKLHVSESFVDSSIDAMKTYGGYGYMTEQEVERDLRDAMGSVFYSGTSDIQRNIIARSLGL
jgi:alkylation response protein AidB-like acyl-CoA dehydrogenase